MKRNTTSWVVTGLGAALTGIGAKMLRGRLRTSAVGFGLAQVAFGVLGMLRPRMRDS